MLDAKVLIAGTVDSAKLWQQQYREVLLLTKHQQYSRHPSARKRQFEDPTVPQLLSTCEEWAETWAVTYISLEINV